MRYYIIPSVDWPEEAPIQHLPFFLGVFADSSFALEPYTAGIQLDYHAGRHPYRHDGTAHEGLWPPMSPGDSLATRDLKAAEDAVENWYQEWNTPEDEAVAGCDICGQQQTEGAKWYACGLCKIYVCETCASESERRTRQAQTDYANYALCFAKSKDQGFCCHQLTLLDGSDNDVFCDVCGQDIISNKAACSYLTCPTCEIDICKVCSVCEEQRFSVDEAPCRHKLVYPAAAAKEVCL